MGLRLWWWRIGRLNPQSGVNQRTGNSKSEQGLDDSDRNSLLWTVSDKTTMLVYAAQRLLLIWGIWIRAKLVFQHANALFLQLWVQWKSEWGISVLDQGTKSREDALLVPG